MKNELFDEAEQELIAAARLILSDGVRRLKTRDGLFPTTKARTRADMTACTNARGALVDYLVAQYGALRYEVASVALIDHQGRLIGVEEFPQGGGSRCDVNPLILMDYIIKSGAAAVVLVHNHPSGDNTPSSQDVRMTEQYSTWLKFAGIELIDHLVISTDGAAAIKGDL